MNRKFGVGLLIFCFGLSSVDAALADQVAQVEPVIVQPYDLSAINEQMIQQDLLNQDQEMAIKGLIDDNQKLAASSLASKQDAELEKINQTMIKYRDALLAREGAHTNIQKISKYYDLVTLTENVDDIKGVGTTLLLKNDVIEEKYKILTDLKDEMTALNEKLKGANFDKISHQQEATIQMLTQQLGAMDKKIAGYDGILAEKDQQIAELKSSLAISQSEATAEYTLLKKQNGQMDLLKSELENKITEGNNQGQNVGLLKSELENKITEVNNLGQQNESYKQQENQTAILKAQLQELSSKEEFMKLQADQMANVLEQLKNQNAPSQPFNVPPIFVPSKDLKELSAVYAKIQDDVIAVENKMNQQARDLRARDESVRWLNQVLSVTKNKAEYYRLTAQQNILSQQQVQEQVMNMKEDFVQRFKDDGQLERDIASLKAQVGELNMQLSKKESQVDLLKSELEHKITEAKSQSQQNTQEQQDLKTQLQGKENQIVQDNQLIAAGKNQSQQDAQEEQDLKTQLQGKENQIVQMKADIQSILQDQMNNETSLHSASAQLSEQFKLAKQLINLQQQETALLVEKSSLAAAQNEIFEKHVRALEKKINGLLSDHQIQYAVLKDRMLELKNELNQKEDQISTMKLQIQAGQAAEEQVDSLKQELVSGQDQADQLKQQLNNKTAESDKLTSMISEYQEKLESKDNAYNEQLGSILSTKNNQARMEKEIAYLNARLQEKEAEVIKIKKDMYDLQQGASVRDRDAQAQDLSLSMLQQKRVDEKIKEYQDRINGLQAANRRQVQEVAGLNTALAKARQQLLGVPSSDELEFLRTGLKAATLQLTQKDAMLARTKAHADEYAKEFKEQSQEFQSLKDQLQEAQEEISRKDEDLKYKDMAITRLKDRSRASESDLKAQIMALTQKAGTTDKEPVANIRGNRVQVLQERLKKANVQIKELQNQLNQLKASFKTDTVEAKLEQAMDKIDEQGRVINALVQKLQDAGKSVDLTTLVQ